MSGNNHSPYRAPKWRSVAFVAGPKRVLMRVLREAGVEVTPEAIAVLDTLPGSFREWRASEADTEALP